MLTAESAPVAGTASTSLLVLLAWGGAVAAGLVAALRQARDLKQLRAQVTELLESAARAEARVETATGAHRAAKFRTMYEESPSLMDRLGALPPTVPIVASAVLALVGAGALSLTVTRQGAAETSHLSEVAALKQANDSLSARLAHLTDSLGALASGSPAVPAAAPAAAPAPRPVPAPKVAAARPAPRPREAPRATAEPKKLAPAPALVPPPKLDAN